MFSCLINVSGKHDHKEKGVNVQVVVRCRPMSADECSVVLRRFSGFAFFVSPAWLYCCSLAFPRIMMERNVSRKEKQAFRQAMQNDYTRELMNYLEGKPEVVGEVVGTEDRDLNMYKAKMEERARREEDLFTRVPLSSMEKKKLKHMRKSRNGRIFLKNQHF